MPPGPTPKIICNFHPDKSLYYYPNSVVEGQDYLTGRFVYADCSGIFRTRLRCSLSRQDVAKPGVNTRVDISTGKVTF